ncbi:MAG: phosphatase PAP2 family protein [Geobacter sp.]|nr:phosphatase PAP2 family protein [Geobacter sp.]
MRSADPLDLLADAVGVLAAYLLFKFLNSRSRTEHCPVFILAATVACLLHASLPVAAADHLLNSTAEYGRVAGRLADEALEVAATPVDTRGYGMLGTLLVTGAVAFTSSYDSDIRDKVGGIKGTTLDHVTDAGSIAGDPFLHLGLAAAVYGGGILAESPKYRELGEMLGEAAILADATTFILKSATGRARPNTGSGSGSFRPFRFAADYDALPSMHTASSFAMASVVASAADNPLIGIGAYAAAAFVGFSRIYQDKHWASDVVLGAAIGELCGRVAMGYHASGKARRFSVAPVVSSEAALVAVTGRF